MIDDLKEFVSKVEGFTEMKASSKIDVFAFFTIKVRGLESFNASHISDSFSQLRLLPYSNIPQYLKKNSNKQKGRKKSVKFLVTKEGYQLEGNFEKDLEEKMPLTDEENFLAFKVDVSKLRWKPSDIINLSNKTKRNAHFFTKLYFLFYHIENSIRKFIKQRLSSILGTDWENKLIANVDLAKAQAIKREVDLTEMLPNRGDNILFFCMWDDYAKIISEYPNIFSNKKESNEIVAHLGTLTKIRNAIAHNTASIPKEYQDELTVFLNKYVKIMKKNES